MNKNLYLSLVGICGMKRTLEQENKQEHQDKNSHKVQMWQNSDQVLNSEAFRNSSQL